MATPTSSEAPVITAGSSAHQALPSHEELIRAYRTMYLARRVDDREILLKRQNKIFFQISGAGHEAVGAAAGLLLKPGHDWFYLYYRDRALCLALGVTPEEMFLGAVGAASDPASGGRQMPSHWGDKNKNIVTSSSPTGTQFLQAVGCAQASRLLDPESDAITLVTSGEGATSEGEFWEALNAACLENLPVLFLIENNGYAISVPVEAQTAGGNVAALASGFPLKRWEVDGTDFPACYRVLNEAISYCRDEKKPALVQALVTRPYSHSLSDDEKLYKTKAERAAEETRDPILRFPEWLVSEGILDRHRLQLIVHEANQEVQDASENASKAAPPARGSALTHLYSEDVDPTSSAFQTEPDFRSADPRTMVDSINLTLHEEMARDPRMVVFGEDVADCSREANLCEVKGKGGVFKATAGLQTKFGSKRCFNSPLAEAAIVGRAIGMASRGLKPVVEVQFFDYIWPAMMQIRDELATIRWRSNDAFKAPVVIRVPIGGYLNGGAIYHSQSGEVLFTHIPGLRVVMPSNALDAAGLLRTAIRCDDPVLFLEHKKLYREPYNRSPHAGPDYLIPFGKAKLVKTGERLTVITYGALVQKCLQAAAQLEQQSLEVIDLRTLAPYDWEAIKRSVEKTNRVMIVHEDTLSFGYGAELAARIADELFDCLDAPVGRVAALDTWVGYNPQLENEILPQVENIVAEAGRLLGY
jgi:2-oxoisovalerate dehydrogenase E1 component